MAENQRTGQSPSRVAGVLTDLQFWVPLAVLLGGLLLLHSLR